MKSKESFFVDFVGSAGRVQVPARLVNSSTLMLETPGKCLRDWAPKYVLKWKLLSCDQCKTNGTNQLLLATEEY